MKKLVLGLFVFAVSMASYAGLIEDNASALTNGVGEITAGVKFGVATMSPIGIAVVVLVGIALSIIALAGRFSRKMGGR